MRRFDASYLETTRRGMWADCREPLGDLALPERESVLDVGCGTGALTRVLREETPGRVIALDADPELLAGVAQPAVCGDATRLPLVEDAVELVVCQALLINLARPLAAVREFARVAADAVAVVEPDNGAVSIDSSIPAEPRLASRARELYLDGVSTDVALGASAADVLAEAGLDVVSTRRYDHVRTVQPPYSADSLERARRMATGDGLDDDREEMLSGSLTQAEYDDLREEWRSIGRSVVEQMGTREYERTESVPFYVTVGEVSD